MSESPHPDPATLRAFALGKLPANEVARISGHISDCDSCAQYLDQPFNETLANQLRNREFDTSGFTTAEQDPSQSLTFAELQNLFQQHSAYQLLQPLNHGGMGAVYLAKHTVMKRDVAIKVIRSEFLDNDEAVARFHKEVQTAAQMTHRNIVAAHDAGQIQGIHFLVMEYVEGESLSDLVLRTGPLSVELACDYIRQAAMGLDHAYQKRMIHRDIKPQNLMRTPQDVIKVLDFGLARLLDHRSPQLQLTTTGVIMGTASYMAPEQAKDARTADIRSDMYSLGCTFYFLLSGQTPFAVSGYVEQVIAHCTEPFPNIGDHRDDVPQAVCRILEQLTQKNAETRFQTPAELIAAISPYGNGAELSASSSKRSRNQLHPKPPVARRSWADRRLWLVLAVAWVAIFSVAAWFNWPESPDSSKKVLAVISSRNFWFSDFGPLKTAMSNHGIELLVTSDRAGVARFNPSDQFPDKHTVEIGQSLTELESGGISDDIDAVVFMGTSVDEFMLESSTSEAVRKLIVDLQSNDKWIGCMGKGINIPMYHGLLNGVRISRTRWIQDNARDRSRYEMVDAAVFADEQHRVLSCSTWDEAAEFGEELAIRVKGK